MVAVTRNASLLLDVADIPPVAARPAAATELEGPEAPEGGADDETGERTGPTPKDPQTVAPEFERAWLGVRVPDADSAELHVAIEKPSQKDVERLSAALEAICDTLRAEVADSKVELSCTHARNVDTLALDAVATNLQAATAASVEEASRKANEPTDRGVPVPGPSYEVESETPSTE